MDDAPKRFSKAALAAGVGGVLLVAGATWLWIERTPIATSYIDDTLKAANVPASYKLTEVGFRTQRIENIRIGDPAHPDLTADWAEIRLGVGLGGVSVKAIDAAGVRLHGKLIDGKLSLGAIDRLLPKGESKAPFALPDIAVTARAMHIDVATPLGLINAQLDGQGGLKGGFRGRALIASDALASGSCAIRTPRATLDIAIDNGMPRLSGPVTAALIDCGGNRVTAPHIDLDARGDADLAHWRGAAVVQQGALTAGDASAARIGGRIQFDASARLVSGGGNLFADGARYGGSRSGRLRFDGSYRYAPDSGKGTLVGDLAADKLMLDPAAASALAAQLASAQATPIGPVAAAWGQALQRAARDANAKARVSLSIAPGGGGLWVEQIDASSASGAHLIVRGQGGQGLGVSWPQMAGMTNAKAELGGGGLPDLRADLRQARIGAAINGTVTIAPYSVGNARLQLAPVAFTADPAGGTRITTRVTMDGPLADGRVEGLALPLSVHLNRHGVLAVNNSCVPLSFARLAVAGTNLGSTTLPLCPIDGAMFGRSASGGFYGGARIAGLRLRGRVGEQPLSLQAQALTVAVRQPGFALDKLAVRIGDPAQPTRLDVDRIEGKVDSRGIGGRFTAANGKIGPVPLLLSQGSGDWRLDGGVLKLKAALRVDDAETASPRFLQLAAPDVDLTLNGGYITASATLVEPRSGRAITTVEIRHSLQSGRGDANLDVKGLRFSKALQPERITPLTQGIIANVEGEVAGQGRIVWAGGNVTSTGAFRTEGINFAAAFGPVTGLKGQIVFTDLLGMVTAPDQTVTIAEANPGVAVTNGVVRYRVLPDFKLAVADGTWPFAGGTLTLEPTVIDMGQPVARMMTFRIDGLDAGAFLQQLEFKNIAVTGKFDGVLPIIFDAQGGRIENGQLRVRPGGGTLSYVGDVTNANLGKYARLAFDALKSMHYDRLTIDLNGSLDGEIVSKVHFDGTNDSPKNATKGQGLLGRFIAPLTRLPFRFNITITAPFRGLVNSAQTFVDPSIVLRNVQVAPQAPPPANPLPDPPRPIPIQAQ